MPAARSGPLGGVPLMETAFHRSRTISTGGGLVSVATTSTQILVSDGAAVHRVRGFLTRAVPRPVAQRTGRSGLVQSTASAPAEQAVAPIQQRTSDPERDRGRRVGEQSRHARDQPTRAQRPSATAVLAWSMGPFHSKTRTPASKQRAVARALRAVPTAPAPTPERRPSPCSRWHERSPRQPRRASRHRLAIARTRAPVRCSLTSFSTGSSAGLVTVTSDLLAVGR